MLIRILREDNSLFVYGDFMSDLDYLKKYYVGDMDEAISKLKSGIPVQYIVGNVDFYGRNFKVNKNVLIPRFETEELVDRTIKYIRNGFSSDIKVLDLCCGSGCIGITLSKELGVFVDASDISSDALEVAKENCRINGANVNFYLGDLFESLNGRYDVIISNPPYISSDEVIDDVVYNNEPHLALFASDDGLYFYDEILKNCSKYLNDKFLIAFEIGCTQGKRIKELAYKYLGDVFVSIEKDLSGRDRFVFIFSK